MRQFFYKSGLICSILIFVSVIFTLCGIALINENNLFKPISGMSSEYILFYPQEERGVGEYADELSKVQDYVVKGVKFQEGCAIDLNLEKYTGLKILEGRFFEEKEYQEKANVLLIREDMLRLCHEEAGAKWFYISNEKYKVVGVYSKGNSNDVRSSRYLVNLYAKGLAKEQKITYGFFDNGSESVSTFAKSEMAQDGLLYNQALEEKDTLNKNIVSNVKAAVVMYVAVGVVVLLNVFSAIYIWLRGKRKEIVLRKMVGAGKIRIFLWVVKDFMIFVLGTFCIGIGIVKLFLLALSHWEFSPSMITVFGTDIEWMGVAMAFVAVFVIGSVIISITVARYLKKEIIQIIRSE